MVHIIIVVVLIGAGLGIHFLVKPRAEYTEIANIAEELIEAGIKEESGVSVDFDDIRCGQQ
jgi:uncharacterized membrane protein